MPVNNLEIDGNNDAIDRQSRPWWSHWEYWLLLLVVALIYLIRLDTLSIRGEESRRAQIGIEMRESGDWIVPRQQGKPFLSRPPLQNWTIVGLGAILGDVDVWAIRLPSVISILCIVSIIYAYSSAFLSRFGSFTAGVALASMPQVMELGRLGETEMMFTFLIAGSLFLWHRGYSRGWSALKTWTIAYLLIALATLTKGPQAPFYFAASIGTYLLVTRNWRYALSWAHLAGIFTFLFVWGSWQVPFYLKLGPINSYAIYFHDVGLRFNETSWLITAKHMAEFPLAIFFGCMMPWSILLFAYINPGFCRKIGPKPRDNVIFLLCVICVTFPTAWLVPHAHTRYLLPIYPFFAPLIGLVADRCLEAQASHDKTATQRWWSKSWKLWWRWWLTATGLVMMLAGLGILLISIFRPEARFSQPLWFATVYFIGTTALGLIAIGARKFLKGRCRLAGPLSVALFMGLTFVGIFTNSLVRISGNTAEAVAALKRQLPEDVDLCSLSETYHLFAYYYGDYIPIVEVPMNGKIPQPKFKYFCFQNFIIDPTRFEFEYEVIAEIPYGRTNKKDRNKIVTVARTVQPEASDRR